MVYKPLIPPNIDNVEDLRRALDTELQKLVESLPEVQEVVFRPLGAAPLKPRDGMLVYADGTNWNPGAGIGLYERRGGAWVKL